MDSTTRVDAFPDDIWQEVLTGRQSDSAIVAILARSVCSRKRKHFPIAAFYGPRFLPECIVRKAVSVLRWAADHGALEGLTQCEASRIVSEASLHLDAADVKWIMDTLDANGHGAWSIRHCESVIESAVQRKDGAAFLTLLNETTPIASVVSEWTAFHKMTPCNVDAIRFLFDTFPTIPWRQGIYLDRLILTGDTDLVKDAVNNLDLFTNCYNLSVDDLVHMPEMLICLMDQIAVKPAPSRYTYPRRWLQKRNSDRRQAWIDVVIYLEFRHPRAMETSVLLPYLQEHHLEAYNEVANWRERIQRARMGALDSIHLLSQTFALQRRYDDAKHKRHMMSLRAQTWIRFLAQVRYLDCIGSLMTDAPGSGEFGAGFAAAALLQNQPQELHRIPRPLHEDEILAVIDIFLDARGDLTREEAQRIVNLFGPIKCDRPWEAMNMLKQALRLQNASLLYAVVDQFMQSTVCYQIDCLYNGLKDMNANTLLEIWLRIRDKDVFVLELVKSNETPRVKRKKHARVLIGQSTWPEIEISRCMAHFVLDQGMAMESPVPQDRLEKMQDACRCKKPSF